MSLPSDQELNKLLAYQPAEANEQFVDAILAKVKHKSKVRQRMLTVSILAACLTIVLMLTFSGVSIWQPVVQFVSQSPLLMTSAIIVALLGGFLIPSEKI